MVSGELVQRSSFEMLILRHAHPSTRSSFDTLILRHAQDDKRPLSP